MYLADAIPADVSHDGYVQHEYLATGTASSYRLTAPLTTDGRWKFCPTPPRPTGPASSSAAGEGIGFSGTVVVEWLNVSGGVDADPEWTSLQEEIVRRGDVWVGVSAQRIGVNGGPVLVKVDVPGSEAAGKGLKAIDPARYGSLDLPGDGFSFDIFTQAARALRTGAGLSGLRPQRLIAAGESQSAFALVTYYDGVEPLAHAFDGYFVHSRGSVGLPLVAPGKYADIAHAITGTPAIFRTDQHAPVLDIQTETDVTSILNSSVARQPDSDRFRLWEVAGTAHADAHLIGSGVKYIHCGVPINNGPMHLVAKAALPRRCTNWIETGTAPVVAPVSRSRRTRYLEPGPTPTASRSAVSARRRSTCPSSALSGRPGPNPSTICLLLGSSKPFSAARLAQLYPSRAEYLARYTATPTRRSRPASCFRKIGRR